MFENRGEAMGASNPHPHGQIWAGTRAPGRRLARTHRSDAIWRRPAGALLLDYAAAGGARRAGRAENDEWLVVVPFWAAWPFETLVAAATPGRAAAELEDAQRDDWRRRCIALLARYDRLFGVPFPYSMGWHQAPFDGAPTRRSGSCTPTSTRRCSLGDRAQVHGRLRDAGRATARPDARAGRRPTARRAAADEGARARPARRPVSLGTARNASRSRRLLAVRLRPLSDTCSVPVQKPPIAVLVGKLLSCQAIAAALCLGEHPEHDPGEMALEAAQRLAPGLALGPLAADEGLGRRVVPGLHQGDRCGAPG